MQVRRVFASMIIAADLQIFGESFCAFYGVQSSIAFAVVSYSVDHTTGLDKNIVIFPVHNMYCDAVARTQSQHKAQKRRND